jgi:hypothetical protein
MGTLPPVDLRSAHYSTLAKTIEAKLLFCTTIKAGFFAGLHLLIYGSLDILDITTYLNQESSLLVDFANKLSLAADSLRTRLEILPKFEGVTATGGARIVANLELGDFLNSKAAFRARDIFALVSASQSGDPHEDMGVERDIEAIIQNRVARSFGMKNDPVERLQREGDYVLGAIREGAVADGAFPSLEERLLSTFFERAYVRKEAFESDILCSVFSRPQATAGARFPLYVFVHKKEDLLLAAKEAMKRDPTSRRRAFETLKTKLTNGQALTFFLDSQDLLVDAPIAHLIWTGDPQVTTFDVSIPFHTTKAVVKGIVFVSVDDVPIGEIPFEIAIGSTAATVTGDLSSGRRFFVEMPSVPNARPASVAKTPLSYRTAFLSYSRKDVAWASLFAEGLTSNGIDLFVDVTAMEPGDEWERVLLRAIAKSDVFFLLWSENAARSDWVNKECLAVCRRWELSGHSAPTIKPIVLHDGAPKPPFCISSFHCDSRWRQMRVAGESKIFGSRRQ